MKGTWRHRASQVSQGAFVQSVCGKAIFKRKIRPPTEKETHIGPILMPQMSSKAVSQRVRPPLQGGTHIGPMAMPSMSSMAVSQRVKKPWPNQNPETNISKPSQRPKMTGFLMAGLTGLILRP
jgi:hypothetical protein